MAKGDIQTGGRRRKEPKSDRIAERVKKFQDGHVATPHVTPLNGGFFKLERMRAATVAKARIKKRRKVRG